jgi:hypothetical protein
MMKPVRYFTGAEGEVGLEDVAGVRKKGRFGIVISIAGWSVLGEQIWQIRLPSDTGNTSFVNQMRQFYCIKTSNATSINYM